MRHGLVVLLALSTVGCAAVFKGSKQDVKFVAVPEGADVRVDNRYVGSTPVSGEMDRNQSTNIVVSKDGFKEQYVQLRRHPDTPWWFWDIGTCVIPVTLCIPVLVDAISGAWFSLDEEVRVKLDPLPMKPTPAAPPPVPPNPFPSPAPASSDTQQF